MTTPLGDARGTSTLRRATAFAWRSLVRQPARAALAVLGVAAVGALLFDMLLLSHGLVLSLRDLLDRSGFDVRVGATERPGGGPLMPDAVAAAGRIAALPSVRSVLTIRMADASLEHGGSRAFATIQGVAGSGPRPWTIMRGTDLPAGESPAPSEHPRVEGPGGPAGMLLSEPAARLLGVQPGDSVDVRASCAAGRESLPPVRFRVAGVADFPFDDDQSPQAATRAESLARACGEEGARSANLILVTSTGDADAAAAAIMALDPDLRALTNDEAVGRMEEGGFTYFRQISTVLTTVTLAFAVLLITVLLTVSVNQRLGAIAALRALGFSRQRVVADVLCESALIVGMGGTLSLPLGWGLAVWLDGILKRMPGIPADLHFFVFEGRALVVHLTLLAATALLAALYPMRIVSRLPIAATLRNEVIS
ncbi:MAG TPA: ABC transporter permease [Vicinamibacterales bacterium]